MIVKTVIITIILVAIIMIALGVKLLFDKNAEFTVHSCSLESGNTDQEGACYKCHEKDTGNCPLPDKGN